MRDAAHINMKYKISSPGPSGFVNLFCQAEAWLHPGILVTQSPSVSVASGIII